MVGTVILVSRAVGSWVPQDRRCPRYSGSPMAQARWFAVAQGQVVVKPAFRPRPASPETMCLTMMLESKGTSHSFECFLPAFWVPLRDLLPVGGDRWP